MHNLGMFRELCGGSTLKNVVLVTTMWRRVSRVVGEVREMELVQQYFKRVLNEGAQLARYHNTAKSTHDIIRRIMKNQPNPLRIQRELVDEGKGITNTAAMQVVHPELNEPIRLHQPETKVVRGETRALAEKEEEARRIREGINQMRVDSKGIAARYNGEKRRTEEAEPQPVPPITIAYVAGHLRGCPD